MFWHSCVCFPFRPPGSVRPSRCGTHSGSLDRGLAATGQPQPLHGGEPLRHHHHEVARVAHLGLPAQWDAALVSGQVAACGTTSPFRWDLRYTQINRRRSVVKFVGAWISSQLFFFFFFPDGFKVYCLFGSISGFCEEILRPLGYSGITHTQDQPIKASCVFDQWIFKDFHHHHDFWIFF